MSLTEIEAELGKLTPDELRRLALKSWTAFVGKENASDAANYCSEDDQDFSPEVEAAWEDEICQRMRSVTTGVARSRSVEAGFADLDRRFGQ